MQIDRALIQKAKEKLGDENERLIVEALGIADYNFKAHKICCPFHQEDTPSFSYNPKSYNMHCFGCGCTYDLLDALMLKGLTFIEAAKKLFEHAGITCSFAEQGVRTRRHYNYPHEEPNGDKAKVCEYLAKRKISPKTADYLDIRQDARGNCVFNYYDANDVLVMVKYRPSHPIDKSAREPKNWCQQGADTSPILFNMNRINPDAPLLITCGELDCAAAIESGFQNAVSIPLGDQNLQWCNECKDWLDQFDDIILCPDNDESGQKFLEKAVSALHLNKETNGKYRDCRIVKIPHSVKIDDGSGGEKEKKLKDLNEYLFYMGKDAALDLICCASYTPIQSIVDLSDVKAVNYEEKDGVKFGLKPLDESIMRLFFGTLTVVSGKPGAGKSSLLGQLMCHTMDQGYNAWMFSGELPNDMSKGWLNSIFAGPRNAREKTSRHGNVYYSVPGSIVGQIDRHYRGHWWIYKDGMDNTLESIVKSMGDAVNRYAVKLLILDNFMCIDTSAGDDELRSQTDTIKRLVRFAREYQVAVVLVCHPRKFDQGTQIGIYDIAGSSNIVNLAHRTIALRRVTDDDRENAAKLSERKQALLQYDVITTVVKDRMFGRQNIDIGIYYDAQSRRFYTSSEEYDHHYSWDSQDYQDVLEAPKLAELEADEAAVYGPRQAG